MKKLKKIGSFLPVSKFSMENAKLYVIAVIICFHILPMIFVFMGPTGQSVLLNMFMFMINPMLIFGISFFYGVRLGFEWKFPLIFGILSTASIVMYYNFSDMNYLLLSAILCAVVYTLFAYLFALFGAFVKKLMGGD